MLQYYITNKIDPLKMNEVVVLSVAILNKCLL